MSYFRYVSIKIKYKSNITIYRIVVPHEIGRFTRFAVDITVGDNLIDLIAKRLSKRVIELRVERSIEQPIRLVLDWAIVDQRDQIGELLNVDIVLLVVVVANVGEGGRRAEIVEVADGDHGKLHLECVDLSYLRDYRPAEILNDHSLNHVDADGNRAEQANEPNDAEHDTLGVEDGQDAVRGRVPRPLLDFFGHAIRQLDFGLGDNRVIGVWVYRLERNSFFHLLFLFFHLVRSSSLFVVVVAFFKF